MLKDRYDNPVSTASKLARDHYIHGVDCLLSAAPGTEEAFQAAISADDQFALAYCGQARHRQMTGNATDARTCIARAQALVEHTDDRQRAHVALIAMLIAGQSAQAYPLIREHVKVYPRDVMLAQTCTSVFGLIGFSGQPGREAEQLAYTESLLPHYGDDWWLLCQHAFSLCETGQLDRAETMIDRSLSINPKSAHSAHIRAHVYYESGDVDAGARYLDQWMSGYPKPAILHCHLSWHVALWALETGDLEKMWQVIDDDVMPDGAWGPPLNVLTDAAAILHRAEIAGVTVPAEYWQILSEYAGQFFPNTGLAFADVHAALVHAMAGRPESLRAIIDNPRGPAADVVKPLACGFEAIASGDWARASAELVTGMADHARIGGSRAQRDLLEFTLANSLLKQGQIRHAEQLLALHRPQQHVRNTIAELP